jgi:hypothetical protein
MTMKTITCILGTLSLVLLSACGGGGGATPTPTPTPTPDPVTYATTLAYQDPAASGFRLVKNASSTNTRLVLDLVGPSGTQAKGVAFFLATDAAKVTWVHPTNIAGSHVVAGTVFPLGTSPQLLKDKVQGGQLQVGLFQKGGTATTLGSAALLTLALDLNGAAVAKGAVDLGPQSGKQAVVLNADGTQSTITISVGTLSAQ